ncbi:MAG: hypothetical protein M3Y71_06540, partial [Actinomycetota bacterium]|nr:hypothetical protein [Actinomycetota bacterium]
MSAQFLPEIDAPTVVGRRTLASVETGGSEARRQVTDVLRLVALSIDANATSGAARDGKYAALRVLVAEVAATGATCDSPEVAAELAALDIEAGLTLGADRVVALVRPALSAEDVAGILREVVATRWADGTRLQCDPAVALRYAARRLTPTTSSQALALLRRPGFIRRLFPHRA